MVKKLTDLAQDKELANAVRSSAQQIWQAGLGAFAKAQEEGGRVFSRLVKEGTEFQKRAEDKVADVSGSVGKLADGVGKQASGSWDKLEQVFEERVARALATIGVPTQQDVAALHAKLDALSAQVAALSGPAAIPAPKPAGKAVAKPAAKPTVKAAVKAGPAAPATVASRAAAAPKAAVKPAVKAAAAKAPAKPVSKPVSKPAARKKAPAP